MGSQRTHIVLPPELIEEIDSEVGPRGRSAFLAEVARAELKRRKLLLILTSDKPIWRDKDHPEFAGGTDKWVRSMRDEWDTRADKASARRKA
jgi:hypothetical protein